MRIEFCLLDLDYAKMDGNVPIILYGRTPDGKRAAVVDPTYDPYFYILPKNLDRAKKGIENLLKKKNVKVKRIEETKGGLFGEEKDFIKVYCFLPRDTGKVRDVIETIEERRGGSGSILDEYEYAMGGQS